ncbi:unnamed protein product, partial [Polarella glacialis]
MTLANTLEDSSRFLVQDSVKTFTTEWNSAKERWFKGEAIDPVYEGVVRDFVQFDETLIGIFSQVGAFMKGVDQLSKGMTVLSDGVHALLSQKAEQQITSDSCKFKEASNAITRADAPHSAIAKLRRDMNFNILTPMQSHMANNKNLKVSLDIRKRRWVELQTCKKIWEDVQKKNLPTTHSRHIQ